jgi:hypothetical protein
MESYQIKNPHGKQGRAWRAEYATRDEAADAIRRSYGWDEVVLSDSFADGKSTAWAVYGSDAEMAGDDTGADAPWIVRLVEVAS